MPANDQNAAEAELSHICQQFAQKLQPLAKRLDAACLSHYSSGCGTKRVTFDLFPASEYVLGFINLLRLDRPFYATATQGYKDATSKGDYNPAQELLLFLARWSQFAEQAMRTEGDAPRGVAAGRAKLLIDALLADLGEGKPSNAAKTTALGRLMQQIATTLETRQRQQAEQNNAPKALRGHHNFLKALAAAQG